MARITMLVTSELDQDPRVQKEALSANEAGYSVTVVCREYRGPKLPYRVVGLNANRKKSRVHKIIERIWTNARLVWATIAAQPDIIHANDLDTLPAGYVASRITGARLVYDAHEFWTGSGRDLGEIGSKLALAMERFLSRRAHSIVTVSPVIADMMRSELKCRSPLVILNAPKYRNPEGLQPGRWLEKFQGKKVALYQGRYVANRGIEDVVLAAKYLPNSVTIALRGYGPIEEELKALVINYRLTEKVVFLPPVPMFDMVDSAVGADLGLALYLPNNKNNLGASPNKLYEYIMALVPVIGSDVPHIRNTLHGLGVGDVFKPGDPQDLANTINNLLDSPNELNKMKENCRACSLNLSWDTQEDILISEYERLLG